MAYCSWSCSPMDKCPTQVSLSMTSRKQKADLSQQQYKEETLDILQLWSYDKGVTFQCMILKLDGRKYAAVHVVMEVQQKFVMAATEKNVTEDIWSKTWGSHSSDVERSSLLRLVKIKAFWDKMTSQLGNLFLIFVVPCIMLYSMWNKSNKMQQFRFYSSQWLLLYMFRATIWWVRLSPETCRIKTIAKNKNAIVASCWTYFTYYRESLLKCWRILLPPYSELRPVVSNMQPTIPCQTSLSMILLQFQNMAQISVNFFSIKMFCDWGLNNVFHIWALMHVIC